MKLKKHMYLDKGRRIYFLFTVKWWWSNVPQLNTFSVALVPTFWMEPMWTKDWKVVACLGVRLAFERFQPDEEEYWEDMVS